MVSVTHWLWIDLEMTGLDPDKERIIELAAILTDPHMNEIDRLGPIVVRQSNELLDAMDDWNQKHHGRSGLVDLVKNSKITEKQCEEMVMDLLRKNKVPKNKSILCGNSIWQDRRFLVRYMPQISEFLHYRMLDVSSFKLVKEHWYPKQKPFEKPKEAHRALEDIEESIREMKYYKEYMLIQE